MNSSYLIAGKLVSEVFNVVHHVVDAHLVRVARSGQNSPVEVVDHGAAGGQGVAGVDRHVARLGRVKTLREPEKVNSWFNEISI